MKRIAMLNCEKSNNVCAGCACFNAYNSRTKGFAQYGDEPLELGAYFRCSRCTDVPLEEDAGMLEKMDRLVSEHIDVIHVGKCTIKNGEECPKITQILDILKQKGLTVVRGTH